MPTINAHPVWSGFEHLMEQCCFPAQPSIQQLNACLARATPATTRSGQNVSFVAADRLPADIPYEQLIHTTGEVSTRPNNWHDVFNAWMWCRFPATKAAINARHVRASASADTATSGQRGRERDLLTLFDECGVVVLSRSVELLGSLAQRDWQTAFQTQRDCWDKHSGVITLGHALLEKFMQPYKAVTAHAILVQVDDASSSLLNDVAIDTWLADQLLSGQLLRSKSDLSPLPLMGIPGWWQQGPQDQSFYADRGVFRPPSLDFSRAQIFSF